MKNALAIICIAVCAGLAGMVQQDLLIFFPDDSATIVAFWFWFAVALIFLACYRIALFLKFMCGYEPDEC